MAHPPNLFGAVAVRLRYRLPSCLSVSRSIFRPLAFEILDDVVGGNRCGKEEYAPEIVVSLFLRSFGDDVRHGSTIDSQTKRQLGPALNHLEDGSSVE